MVSIVARVLIIQSIRESDLGKLLLLRVSGTVVFEGGVEVGACW